MGRELSVPHPDLLQVLIFNPFLLLAFVQFSLFGKSSYSFDLFKNLVFLVNLVPTTLVKQEINDER